LYAFYLRTGFGEGGGSDGEGENVMALQRDQGDTSFSQSTRLGFVCLELYFTFFLFVFLEGAAF